MENLLTMDGGHDDFVNPETDEIIPEEYIRAIYGYEGPYRQHMTATDDKDYDEGKVSEVDVEGGRELTLQEKYEAASPDEQERLREEYPYLFYEGETRVDTYWRKWRNAVRNPYDFFAWRMVGEAGELLGLELIDDSMLTRIKSDVRANNRMREKYLYRIDKCAEAKEVKTAAQLYDWVHARDR